MNHVRTVDFGSAPFQIIDGDRGKNYPKQDEFSDDGFCMFLNASNVTRKGFDFSQCQFVSEQKDGALRKGKLQRDDVVLTTRGTIGNTAFYSAAVPFEHMRINSGMVILRCDQKEILPSYLYHFLRSPHFHGQVNALRSGVAQPQLPIRDMRSIILPLPKLHTQKSIASILSAYDNLIENNRRRIQLLEQAARLLYKEWFVHLRFPGHEHVKIKNGVPEGWERRILGEAVQIMKGKSITQAIAQEGAVPVVAGGLEPAYYHNQANATGPVVTISASGANAGFVNIYHEDIWASDCSYINSESTNHLYYYYCHLKDRQQEVFGFQKGAAQPHVYPKDFMRLVVMSPPDKLLQHFTDSVSPLFAFIKSLGKQNGSLSSARDLLLPRLMNGEVSV